MKDVADAARAAGATEVATDLRAAPRARYDVLIRTGRLTNATDSHREHHNQSRSAFPHGFFCPVDTDDSGVAMSSSARRSAFTPKNHPMIPPPNMIAAPI